MWDFMRWYHVILFILFIVMVFSPVWFFNKVERVISGDEKSDKPWQYLDFVDPSTIVKQDLRDEDMEKEHRVLENIDKMIAAAKDKYNKTLWEIKKAEYLREIRWRRLTTTLE